MRLTAQVASKRGLRIVASLFATASAIGCAALSLGQAPAPGSAAAPPIPDSSQAAATIVFEVSTIKVSKSGETGSGTNMRNGTFTANNVALKNLMQYQAYGIPQQRILGGPKWLDSVRFDIEAKPDSSAIDQMRKLDHEQARIQIQRMFQQLLADRFKLAVHWETRELPVYTLVVAKNGPTLQKTTLPEGSSSTSSGDDRLTAKGVTMEEFCKVLTADASRDIGRVVIDKSGIAGRYDFSLKWTPQIDTGGANTGADGAATADSGPSIFTAVQEQLGLKLESAKGPVQVLVIDHVEMPQEN
jgi:uncharacterized protein (TIGR03435 family)